MSAVAVPLSMQAPPDFLHSDDESEGDQPKTSPRPGAHASRYSSSDEEGEKEAAPGGSGGDLQLAPETQNKSPRKKERNIKRTLRKRKSAPNFGRLVDELFPGVAKAKMSRRKRAQSIEQAINSLPAMREVQTTIFVPPTPAMLEEMQAEEERKKRVKGEKKKTKSKKEKKKNKKRRKQATDEPAAILREDDIRHTMRVDVQSEEEESDSEEEKRTTGTETAHDGTHKTAETKRGRASKLSRSAPADMSPLARPRKCTIPPRLQPYLISPSHHHHKAGILSSTSTAWDVAGLAGRQQMDAFKKQRVKVKHKLDEIKAKELERRTSSSASSSSSAADAFDQGQHQLVLSQEREVAIGKRTKNGVDRRGLLLGGMVSEVGERITSMAKTTTTAVVTAMANNPTTTARASKLLEVASEGREEIRRMRQDVEARLDALERRIVALENEVRGLTAKAGLLLLFVILLLLLRFL